MNLVPLSVLLRESDIHHLKYAHHNKKYRKARAKGGKTAAPQGAGTKGGGIRPRLHNRMKSIPI